MDSTDMFLSILWQYCVCLGGRGFGADLVPISVAIKLTPFKVTSADTVTGLRKNGRQFDYNGGGWN